jgi:hypothetical protein
MYGFNTEQRTAIYDWVNGVTGVAVYWEGQNNTRVVKPFITITGIHESDELDRPSTSVPTITKKTYQFFKRDVIRVTAFDDTDARAIIKRLTDSTFFTSTRDLINGVGVYIRYIDDLSIDENKLSSGYEYTASADFVLAYGYQIERDVVTIGSATFEFTPD